MRDIYKGRRDYLRHKDVASWKCGACNANEEAGLSTNQMPTTTIVEHKEFDANDLENLNVIDKVILNNRVS
jgi:hypothetical protein